MKPDMICLVDIEGNQLAGNAPWKRTSEILSHLGIYKTVPTAAAVVHAHPIHATAFAMAGIEPPRCLIPEVEVFVGTIPVAEYKTPGSPQMSEILGKLAPHAPVHPHGQPRRHLLGRQRRGRVFQDGDHGLLLPHALGRRRSCRPSARPSRPTKSKSCSTSKRNSGLPDERHGLKAGELCDCDPWEQIADRPVTCATPAGPSPAKMSNAELEGLVQKLTEEVMGQLGKAK